MGTNTRIRSMAIAALLTAACGGGDGTECGPGTIEVEDQCRPTTGGGEAEAEAESEAEAEAEAGCGDELTVCAVGEQCWSLLHDGRVPPVMREVCGPPNAFIGALSGTWLLVELVRDGNSQPTNDRTGYVIVDPGSPDCNCSKQTPGDACVYFRGNANTMILSGSSLYATGRNKQLTENCSTVFAADIEGQVLQDGQRVEYTARYATGSVQRLAWEKQ